MSDFLSFESDERTEEIDSHEATKELRKNLAEINDPTGDSLTRLHNEIISFCENLELSEEYLEKRSHVVSEVSTIAKSLWGTEVQTHMFGSQATGTATETSDIDLAILGCACSSSADDTVDTLVTLADKFKEKGFASYLEIIPNAKVPIIKMDHKESGISLDICCNETTGLQGASAIISLSKDFPAYKYLILVLKVFLSRRKLHETYSGGIGSFVLSMMVISFLQQRQRVHHAITAQSWNLGSLLMDFLNLYGCTFNYNRVVISVRDGGTYLSKHPAGINKPLVLSIENPMDPDSQYLGENSFLIPKIRRSFEHALQVLTISMAKNSSSKALLANIL